MKAFLLALLVAVSAGTWSYTKFQNRTGYGNTATTMKAAGIVTVILFVVVFTVGKFVLFR